MRTLSVYNSSDDDPIWKELCAPLLMYLSSGPKTNRQIFDWRKSSGIGPNSVTQMLAWCENRYLIRYKNNRWELRSQENTETELMNWLNEKTGGE